MITPATLQCRSVPDISQRDPEAGGRDPHALAGDQVGRRSRPRGLRRPGPRAPTASPTRPSCAAPASAGGEEQRLVVRVAPTKHLLFLDAEFSTQYRAMRALADGGSAVPLPRLGWYEEDPQYFGVPFFSMDHIEGQVPSDNIPYTMEGWVIEATPEQQERMWWSGIDALAAVHRTDWRAARARLAGRPRPRQAGDRAADVVLPGLPRLGDPGGEGSRDRVDLAVAGGPPARRGGRGRHQLG